MPPSSRSCGPSCIRSKRFCAVGLAAPRPTLAEAPSSKAVPDGRVELVAVVHLEDLDVPVGPEPPRRLLDQRAQHG